VGPIAARIAFDAGVGARLPMRIGGKISPLSASRWIWIARSRR
jgi:microcystin degradation protein MlrC